MENKNKDPNVCKTTYETTIFVIFCIILFTLFISCIILLLNIINYILFTVYCISDNIYEYTADVPDDMILGTKYKYRLLNYIKNINDNEPRGPVVIPSDTSSGSGVVISPSTASDTASAAGAAAINASGAGDTIANATSGTSSNPHTVIKEYYDTNSSDLYIHKTIIYYNYIVKMLVGIMLIIVVMLLYNLFYIGMMAIGNCDDTVYCGFLLSDIMTNDAYIYYIIIAMFLYIYAHSYLYTYFFNKNIYKELYDIYAGEDGTAGVAGEDGENKYKSIDTIVSSSITYILTKTVDKKDTDTQTGISLFLTDLNNMSFDILDIEKVLSTQESSVGDTSDTNILLMMNEGIINNNKFIVPTKLEKDGNINILLKHIYNTQITTGIKDEGAKQTLLGHQIFVYLIYNYVITNSIEDPFIIHKLNNVYLNLFNNLFDKYNAANGGNEEPNALIEMFDRDVRKMFKDVKGAFAIKLLLPVGTDKNKVLQKLHENANLMLKYINKVKRKALPKELVTEADKLLNTVLGDLSNYKTIGTPETIKNDHFNTLKTTIRDNIEGFASGFSNYYQEDKTLAVVNRVVYKINFYLAIDMMATIIYILIVLLILYKSGKYPYMEKQINLAITYAIIIINELVSAILGIV
jgi:hypothetical protein